MKREPRPDVPDLRPLADQLVADLANPITRDGEGLRTLWPICLRV